MKDKLYKCLALELEFPYKGKKNHNQIAKKYIATLEEKRFEGFKKIELNTRGLKIVEGDKVSYI